MLDNRGTGRAEARVDREATMELEDSMVEDTCPDHTYAEKASLEY